MNQTPNGKKRWLFGLIRASVLALACVCVAAEFIEARGGPWPIHTRWPHLDPLFAPIVLGPAIAFWWFFFTYHWRGRAFLAEIAAAIRNPLFWALLAYGALLFCIFSLMLDPPG
jgi:hypothetical protein